MVEELKEIEQIANNSEKPTFENTIVAMEKSGELLNRSYRIFSNLNASNTNPTMQKIDKELSPKISAHRDAIHLNGPLFTRVQRLYEGATNSGWMRNRSSSRALLQGFRARRREAVG